MHTSMPCPPVVSAVAHVAAGLAAPVESAIFLSPFVIFLPFALAVVRRAVRMSAAALPSMSSLILRTECGG